MMTATDGDGDLEADLPPTSSSASTAIAAVATNTPKLLRFVRFIESVQVPWSSSRSKNDGKGSSNDVQPVFIIAGLERVIGSSSTSRRKAAADAVSICGVYPPRYLFYMVSGFLCDIIQFAVDTLLYRQMIKDASACWALSFTISIVFRHTTHSYLVFGPYVGSYWQSLARMYTGYSIIIVLSTAFNLVMTKYLTLPHIVAWIITLLWTGIVNYFILKKLWTFGGTSSNEKKKTDAEIPSTEEEIVQDMTESLVISTDLSSSRSRKDIV